MAKGRGYLSEVITNLNDIFIDLNVKQSEVEPSEEISKEEIYDAKHLDLSVKKKLNNLLTTLEENIDLNSKDKDNKEIYSFIETFEEKYQDFAGDLDKLQEKNDKLGLYFAPEIRDKMRSNNRLIKNAKKEVKQEIEQEYELRRSGSYDYNKKYAGKIKAEVYLYNDSTSEQSIKAKNDMNQMKNMTPGEFSEYLSKNAVSDIVEAAVMINGVSRKHQSKEYDNLKKSLLDLTTYIDKKFDFTKTEELYKKFDDIAKLANDYIEYTESHPVSLFSNQGYRDKKVEAVKNVLSFIDNEKTVIESNLVSFDAEMKEFRENNGIEKSKSAENPTNVMEI